LKSRKDQFPAKQTQFRNLNLVLSVFIFLLALLVYGVTAYPELGGGDSAELTVVARTLGVAHPPGYPLFTLLAHLWSLLPFGSVAWRLNFFSGVLNAFAAVVLFLSVTRWTRNAWAGFLSAGLFAFTPLVWTYATTTEVFSLNNLFVAGLVYISVRLAEGESPSQRKWAYFAGFWLGLGLSNHHILIFYGIPFLMWLFIFLKGLTFQRKQFLVLVLCFVAGFLPYLYLPIASRTIPLAGWGDPTSVSGFLSHFFRTEYGTFQLGAMGEGRGIFWNLLGYQLQTLPWQWSFVGVAFAALGIYVLLKKSERNSLGLLWIGAFSFYTLVFTALSDLDLNGPIAELQLSTQARFYQQAYLLIAVWAGIGFNYLASSKNWASWVSIGLVGIHIGIHYVEQDQSHNRVFNSLAKAILQNLPPHSIVLSAGDHISSSLRYSQLIDHYRTDVIVLDQNGLANPWMARIVRTHFPDVILPGNGIYSLSGFHLKQFLDANLSHHPIFAVYGLRPWDTSYIGEYATWAWGYSWRILPVTQAPPLSEWIDANETAFKTLDTDQLRKFSHGTWEAEVNRYYSITIGKYGTQLLQNAASSNDEFTMRSKAVQMLEKSIEVYPENTDIRNVVSQLEGKNQNSK
jgi:hypothetical protein